MRNGRRVALFCILAGVLAGSVLAGLAFGSARLGIADVLCALAGKPAEKTAGLIVWQLRMPRVAGALIAGAGLAVAGLLLQCATDNDLCSPNVMGVNAGAGLAVMVFLCLFPMAFRALPAAAFAGAFGTTMVVLGASFSLGHHTSKTTVVLAGVAVGTLMNAGISFLSQLFPEVLSSYASFSAGGFSGVYAQELAIPGCIVAAGLACAQGLAPRMNLLCLGDELAQALGVRVKWLRLASLTLASALCAAVVSYAGLLGFVGLVVPHMARRLAGHDMRMLVPVCTLLGASLVVLSDLAGRTLFSPAELPAGILMAAMGAPFFLFLLFKRGRTYD